MKISVFVLALLGFLVISAPFVLAQDDSSIVDDGNTDVDQIAEGDDAEPTDSAPEDAALQTQASDDDDDDDEDDEDDSDNDDSDVLASETPSASSAIEPSPCGCKGRVKNPGDEFPFDVRCTCDIEKPDFGRLPSLKVSGQTELNGLAYLGYAPFTSNLGKPMQSGFYQAKGNKPGVTPDKSHPWTHLINVRHSNIASNHQLQIAGSFKTNDRLFFRKIATTLKAENPEWIELATRSTANTFQGQQTIQVRPVSTNGNTVGLELYAEDENPPKVNTQHPSIRFHHAYRFWHRLEGRRSGLHVKVGKEDSNNYSPIYASHFRSVSDAQAKDNIVPMGDVLTSLRGLKGYRYDLVSHGYDGERILVPSIGVLAQELMTRLPEAVSREDNTDQHFVDYNALVATTVHGLQQLLEKTEAERDSLSQRLDALTAKVAELAAKVDKN